MCQHPGFGHHRNTLTEITRQTAAMSIHQVLSGCFDWTLSDNLDDEKVKFGWKKNQTK